MVGSHFVKDEERHRETKTRIPKKGYDVHIREDLK